MHRLILSMKFALVPLLLTVSASALFAGEKKKPLNIVVVLADDLGWGDLACYGHPVIKTPNLDKFAKQGMRFTQCYSASSVCSPSRSGLLTGRTPYRNGVYRWIPAGSQVHLRQTEITIAALLKQAGYATCHVGKWHLNGMFNNDKQPQPNNHGFDWWLATQNNAAPSHKDPKNFVRNGKALGLQKGYSATLIAEEAVHWLKKERDKSKPFYLQMWFHEPHAPIETDPRFQKNYPDLMKNDPNKAQHHGNVTQMDHAFGMLMDALDDMGLSDNTIVIFTSDNGPEGDGVSRRFRGSTGGLRGRKRSMYEGGIRVPGIIRWPGHIQPGSTSSQPVIGNDIFTTLCAITKITPPQDRVIDGVDISPAFQGKEFQRKTPMYWRCVIAREPSKAAMRIGDYVILGNRDLTKFEMYNTAKDLKQEIDLVAKEPQKFQQMKQAFVKLDAEILKEGPDWWKNDNRGKGKKSKKRKKGKKKNLLVPKLQFGNAAGEASDSRLFTKLEFRNERLLGNEEVKGNKKNHRLLVADYSTKRIALLGPDGKIQWQHKIGPIHDLHLLPNGNILFQLSWTRIVEMNPRNNKIVWEYDSAKANGNDGKRVEVHAFHRLPNGATMIAESGVSRIIEVDNAGKLLHQMPLQVAKPHPHRDTRLVRKLDTGNYLVAHESEGAVREYHPSGKVVWEYRVPLFGKKPRPGHGPKGFGNAVFAALRQPDGNTLIATGNGHSVLEVTPAKKIVWSLKQKELPGITLAWVTTLQVLPGGNIVIGNCHAGSENPQVIEITRDKRVVWTFRDFERFGNATSNSQVVGVEGKSVR